MSKISSEYKAHFNKHKPDLDLLLISSGLTARGAEIAEMVKASPECPKTVMLVAYAADKQDKAAADFSASFAPHGIKIVSAHTFDDPVAALDKVDGVVVCGGNTFRLLDRLQKTGLLQAVAQKAKEGMPYVGSSAGSIVACPTIMVNSDPPIVCPASFDAMGLVRFQIKPHYKEVDLYAYNELRQLVPYKGDTIADKISAFHEEHGMDVLGLGDGAALRIKGKHVELRGGQSAKLFRRGKVPVSVSGKEIEGLLCGAAKAGAKPCLEMAKKQPCR